MQYHIMRTWQGDNMRYPHYIIAIMASLFQVALLAPSCSAGDEASIRVGIIGLDTSHVKEFTKLMNDPKAAGALAKVKVVAAYPGGSDDISYSRDRVPKYVKWIRGQGVDIVDSIQALVECVDAVMLESVDGRVHLEQARPVIAAGKPLFIDKPMAASLADAMRIFRLAEKNGVPCFSASALRFSSGFQAAGDGSSRFGAIRRCTAWSPAPNEPHHPEFFGYGIHGVETLFTIMGSGCLTVSRPAANKAVGRWRDGREGIFLAQKGFGAEVEGSLASGSAGAFEGYQPLVVEIAKFFITGKPPVEADETLEILAFMEAAAQSKREGGAPVSIESVLRRAEQSIAEDAP